MTLTKFMARSTWVAHAFEWEKLLKCHLKGKASKKLANGQNIDYSEKRKRPKGFICPCTGVKYHNIQTCLLVYAADSGERLQDHWSSGFNMVSLITRSASVDPKENVIMRLTCIRFYMVLVLFSSARFRIGILIVSVPDLSTPIAHAIYKEFFQL